MERGCPQNHTICRIVITKRRTNIPYTLNPKSINPHESLTPTSLNPSESLTPKSLLPTSLTPPPRILTSQAPGRNVNLGLASVQGNLKSGCDRFRLGLLSPKTLGIRVQGFRVLGFGVLGFRVLGLRGYGWGSHPREGLQLYISYYERLEVEVVLRGRPWKNGSQNRSPRREPTKTTTWA